MVLPGHLAGGYLAALALLTVGEPSITAAQASALLAIGAIAGDGPDIDLFLYYFNQRSKRPSADSSGHRHYITHTPAFWLVLSLIIFGIGLIADSTFVQYIGWVILAGSWSHLLLDSIEFGVRWLWPIMKRRYYLLPGSNPVIDEPKGTLRYYRELIRATAFRNVTFYAEITVTAIAIVVLFQSLSR